MLMQRQFTVVRLNISHSIHLGSHREDYETSETMLHSDALYAAIIQAWRSTGIAHPMVSNSKLATTPELGFAISSLFPYFKASEKADPIYFFPVPISGLPLKNESIRNTFKNIQWLDLEQYHCFLQTGFLKDENTDFIKGKFYTNRVDFEKDFMQFDLHPRVYVPHIGKTNDKGESVTDTEIFYIERMFFSV
jgi:CRISPR/Cas system CSM-associated protein Csm4 (group 5 of RAMP superfamily)